MKRLIRFPGRFLFRYRHWHWGKKTTKRTFLSPTSFSFHGRFTRIHRWRMADSTWIASLMPSSSRRAPCVKRWPRVILFHWDFHHLPFDSSLDFPRRTSFFFNQLLIQMGWFIVFNNLTAFTLFQFYFMSNIPSDFKSNHQIPVYIFSFVISLIHVYNWLKWSQTFYSISGLPFLLTLK